MKMLLKIGVFAFFVSTTFAQVDASDRSPSFKIQSGRSFVASKGRPTNLDRVQPNKHTLAASIVSDLAEAMSVIGKNHTDGTRIQNAALTSTAIDEMLRTLDPHSRYYDEREFTELNGGHRSEYSGTGMFISDHKIGNETGVYVLAVGSDTSAERAGLKFGDRIISIDRKSIIGLNSAEVRDLVRGPNGSEISLSIGRADGTTKQDIVLRRGRITSSSISNSFVDPNGVGYVGLRDGFSFSTAAEFGLAVADLKEAGMTSLV